MLKDDYCVLSLGGSIIVPDQIDVVFIKEFISVIKEFVQKGFRFIIITGGGKTCRRYDDSLKIIISTKDKDLDLLGIFATKLNAEFLRICFADLAYEEILLNPEIIPQTDKPIIVGGGWKPGSSSDLVAVLSAKNVGVKKVINLSNIDFVYDKDPNVFFDAQIIKESSWKNFKEILPKFWVPGLSVPFDPVAAKEAEKNKMEVVIMNGKNLENLKNYLNSKDFIGSVIK
jgi:uridylate kinase